MRRGGVVLSAGMTGVKIPRHVGSWFVMGVGIPALDRSGNARTLFALGSETFGPSVQPMMVDERGNVICVKMLDAAAGRFEKFEERTGWKILRK